MKARVLIISAIVLIAGALGAFLLVNRGQAEAATWEQATWEGYSDEQLNRALERLVGAGALPAGDEEAFLVWLFRTHPDTAEGFVRQNAEALANLPWYMSDTAWDLVRARDIQTGLTILGIARQVFPNDPDVLGMTGVVEYLRGNREVARRLLEEAETWRKNRPIVDFYLGGLLVESDRAADRTRGKAILMGLLSGGDTELKQLSGLLLLSNTAVPMIPEDMELIYDTLDKADVFRLDNDNLPIEALRIITNRLAQPFPEKAMALADLLMQYEGTSFEDYIGMIRLAQELEETEKARQFLDAVDGNEAFASLREASVWYKRVNVTQLFMEERYDEGLAAIRAMVENTDTDTLVMQDTFRSILNREMPMSAERELLELYLRLPVQSVRTSLSVLSRLIQIDPLEEERFIRYAIENLLAEESGLVGSWLMGIDAPDEIIAALADRSANLNSEEAVILVEAYLKEEEPALAQQALDAATGIIDPVVRAFLQSRIYLARGNTGDALVYWEEAHQGVVGTNQFPLMKNVGFLALQLDQPVNAMQTLYTALIAGIPFSQEQAGQLIGLTLRYGTLRQSMQVAEYLANNFPGTPLHENNLAYFRFLAEEQVEKSVETMRGLAEEYPDIIQFKLTLALGLVKAGRTNEAARLLKSTDINWQETSNRGLLIYVVVLAATNQRTVAQGLMQNLDMEDLIPEEKALLEAF